MKTFTLLALSTAALLASCTIERTDNSEDGSDTTDSALDTQMDSIAAPFGRSADSRARTDGASPTAADTTAFTGASQGESFTLYPVDEGDEDPSFFAFRMRMLEAVVERDAEALLEAIDEDVRISFGPGGGREDFRDEWNPYDPESEVWTTLGRVLGGGGTFLEGESIGDDLEATFQAPYYFAEFPGNRFDAFQTGVIIGDAVAVRAQPNHEAQVVDTVGFTVVGIRNFEATEGGGDRWMHVTLNNDRQGYVPESAIASPIGYRAIFQKRDGQWLMTALVAGD